MNLSAFDPSGRRVVPAVIGTVVLAGVLGAALYLNAAHGFESLDAVPAPAAIHRLPVPAPDAGTATVHAGVDFDAMRAEPDPSPRSVAAYGN
jgi:hypothetical protein